MTAYPAGVPGTAPTRTTSWSACSRSISDTPSSAYISSAHRPRTTGRPPLQQPSLRLNTSDAPITACHRTVWADLVRRPDTASISSASEHPLKSVPPGQGVAEYFVLGRLGVVGKPERVLPRQQRLALPQPQYQRFNGFRKIQGGFRHKNFSQDPQIQK